MRYVYTILIERRDGGTGSWEVGWSKAQQLMEETDEVSGKSDREIREREREREKKEKLTPQELHPQAEQSPLQDAQLAQVHGDMMIFDKEPFLFFLSFLDDARGVLALALQWNFLQD